MDCSFRSVLGARLRISLVRTSPALGLLAATDTPTSLKCEHGLASLNKLVSRGTQLRVFLQHVRDKRVQLLRGVDILKRTGILSYNSLQAARY